jgi:hypothetical protein
MARKYPEERSGTPWGRNLHHPIEVVTAEALAYSLVWEHRLGTRETLVRIELADGRVIRGDDVQGVLNRRFAQARLEYSVAGGAATGRFSYTRCVEPTALSDRAPAGARVRRGRQRRGRG